MVAMTDDEIRKFIDANSWATGIKVDGDRICFEDLEANALYLRFPETPLRATYYARLVAMLGVEEESMFYGALLWITLSDIGSPQLEKTGWNMIEMMRRGFGEIRPLAAAPGHSFRNGAVVDFAAFILICFVFGWDANIVPSGGNFFIHISHDEYWTVITRNRETHLEMLEMLKELDPVESHQSMLSQFCPNSKYVGQFSPADPV